VSRIPFQELFGDAKRQPTELISPHELGCAITCKLGDDPWTHWASL
jgi:hypothetical protein